jgi:hypothetical protein
VTDAHALYGSLTIRTVTPLLPQLLPLHNRYDKRSLGPAGLLGWQNYTMTPAELRDQMYRTFGLKPTAAQLGAIVHMFGTTTSSSTTASSSSSNGVDSGGSAADTATAIGAAADGVAKYDSTVTADGSTALASAVPAVVVVKVPDFLNSFFKVRGCQRLLTSTKLYM